jgi:hypothetical protein
MSIDGGSGRGELTLAFSLSAIERLETPAAEFEDAQNWSRFVGVVDSDVEAVEKTVAEYTLQQDFDLDDNDKWLAMQELRKAASTRRHVYVGATEEDRRVATQLGWEYITVTEAAKKAGWTLSGEESEKGSVARFLKTVPGRLFPFGSK